MSSIDPVYKHVSFFDWLVVTVRIDESREIDPDLILSFRETSASVLEMLEW